MIEHLSMEEWQAFDAAHPAPTFFSRPAWAQSLAQANPGMQPAPLRVSLRSKCELIVPLMKMPGGKFGWRHYCGFPLGGYTCFLQADGGLANAADCAAAIREIQRLADRATIIPWPMAPMPDVTAYSAMHEAAVVDLGCGIDSALSGVAGIFRRMAGQAERRGVVCAPSTDECAVDVYYDLLENSARRWGLARPHISKPLIEALVRNGGADVEIWFARAEERAIAGGVIFYGSEELFFWSAAMLTEFGRLRPSNALNFALMRTAAERGLRWYNLGASDGLPGVARFKRDLGASDMPYPRIETARAPFKVYRAMRNAVPSRSRFRVAL